MMKKRTFSLLMALLVAVAVIMPVSCGASDGSVKRVRKAGGLKIGYVSAGDPENDMPMASEEGGIIFDVCRSVAKSIRTEARLVPVSAENAYDRLMDGSVDCLWNVSSPPKQYLTSVRTITTDIYCRQMIITVSDSDITKLVDLNGKKMAVVSGSDALSDMNEATVMKKALASVNVCGSLEEAAEALRSGEADCAAVGEPQAMYLQYISPDEFRCLDSIISEGTLVIAFRFEDAELCEKAAKKYISMTERGEVDKIWRKYIGGVCKKNDDTNV